MATEHHLHQHQGHGHGAASSGGGKADGSGGAGGTHHSHKSFKRKYRKLKLRFDAVMKQSDDLFRKDIIATAQVKRITEENVRLLDLLLDLNSTPHLPRHKRYNIGSPSCSTPVGFLSPEHLAQYQNSNEEDVEPMEFDPVASTTASTIAAAVVDKKLHSIAGAVRDSDSSESEASDDSEEGDDVSEEDEDEEEEEEDFPRDIPEYDDLSGSELELEEIREERYKRGEPTTPPLYVRKGLEAQSLRRAQRKKEARRRARRLAKKDKNGVIVKPESSTPLMTATSNTITTTTTAAPGSTGMGGAELQIVKDKDKPRILLPPDDLYHPGSTPPYLRDPSPFLLTVKEEEEYYASIDQYMCIHPNGPSNSESTQHNDDAVPPVPDIAEDQRNPMSVFSWLKRNQPQIFLQEVEEPGSGGGGAGAGAGAGGAGGPGRKGGRGKSGPKRRVNVEGEDDELHAKGQGLKRKRKGEEQEGVRTGAGVITPVKIPGGAGAGGAASGSGGKGGSGSGGKGGRGSGGRGRKKKEVLQGAAEEGTPVGKKLRR
ncbi:IEC3 subunit of the Ino80 complex, chromatin re-modelling-domain-containing protein [Tirmania nivea]|nr:IEC3 subunit of the Ino80 complex, chromatin re-modelling-domain-containing protein [Tirmania nivea]